MDAQCLKELMVRSNRLLVQATAALAIVGERLTCCLLLDACGGSALAGIAGLERSIAGARRRLLRAVRALLLLLCSIAWGMSAKTCAMIGKRACLGDRSISSNITCFDDSEV
jgi:hypothetical protein